MSNAVFSETENLIALEESNFSAGKVPPHSLEAEQSVIGAILIDNEAINTVIELLSHEDFYIRSHVLLYQAMLDLYERDEPVDFVSLTEFLKSSGGIQKIGGIEYISQLLDVVPTSANVGYYARVVRSMALRRRVIHQAGEIVEDAFKVSTDIDAFIDSVEQRIFQISDERINQGFSRVSEVVKDAIKEVERRYISREPITGVASGFIDFDMLTAGLQPSDLVIIAGRPAMGKTALALSMARNVAVDSKGGVAVFSLEMSREQIVTRLLCSEARVDSSRVRTGKLKETEFRQLIDAASHIYQAPIFIDDTPAISVLEMRAKARRLQRENPLSLIIIDYLQLMRGSHRRVERREQEISEISRSLKALAKELKLPVVALSQLNRSVESRNDKRPIMADLRESGAIEQDADLIGFVYRDEVYNPDTEQKGVAELIIAKHRNGAIGTVKLAFQGEYTLFENLANESNFDYLGSDLSFSAEDDDGL